MSEEMEEKIQRIKTLEQKIRKRAASFQKIIAKTERRAVAAGLERAAEICSQRGLDGARDDIYAEMAVVLGDTKPRSLLTRHRILTEEKP